MDLDFAELELLAQQPIDFEPQASLETAALMYEMAPLHELFDLLEAAVESYTLVRASLVTTLRESAEKEIEFFLSLLQERLNLLLEQSKMNHLQPQLQFA